MLKPTNVARIIVVIAVLVASSAMVGTALARRDATQEPQNKQVLEQKQAKQSLVVVGSLKDGKVSKLADKSSDQGVKVLAQLNSRESTSAFYGK